VRQSIGVPTMRYTPGKNSCQRPVESKRVICDGCIPSSSACHRAIKPNWPVASFLQASSGRCLDISIRIAT
jgi:hypothetical protein